MKYKYEFEVDESFQKGCCHDCPLSYTDDDCDVHCVLYSRYDECPLKEVEEE